MKKTIAIVILTSLAACKAAPVFDQAQADANAAQLDAAAQRRCTSFGYQTGTPDFNQCVFNVKSQFLQAVMVPAPPMPTIDLRPTQPTTQTQTRCYRSGPTVNCTSY